MDIRIFIFLALLFLIDLYLYKALGGLFSSTSGIVSYALILFFWLSTVLLYVLFIDALWIHKLSSGLILYIRAIVFIAYFSKVLMLIPFVLEDVYDLIKFGNDYFLRENAIYDNSRNKFIRNLAIGLASIPSVTLLYGMLGNQYRFRTLEQKISLNNFPSELNGLKIIQISDIHAGTFVLRDPLKNVVDMINSRDPDIVVFTGDLVNNKAEEAERFKDIFSQIKSKYGIYSILGNHDYADHADWENEEQMEENMQYLYDIHDQMGWDLLLNENRKVTIADKEVVILGVENYSTLEYFPRKGDLSAAYSGSESADFRILLSHDPTHWDYEINKDFKDIPLTLSGHTHGFQFGVEIPGYLRWSPSQYVYEQWAGLYQKGEQYIYVNRGLGCLGYPGRVGILPEITELTLYSS